MISLVATLLLVAADPTAAGSTLSGQVKARLQTEPVITGTFEQSKQVKGFKRPLKSSGTYRVAKGEGVAWNTEQPFASNLEVKADQIVAREGGKEAFRLDAKQEPTVRVITTLLFSLLSGDLDALEQHFVATGTVGELGWALELTPKPGPLAKVFSRISLKGNTAVETVHLVELSGDATFIALTRGAK